MVANEIASRPPCAKLTYGPARAEVLSALFSTVTILVLSLILVYSAIVRLVGACVWKLGQACYCTRDGSLVGSFFMHHLSIRRHSRWIHFFLFVF